MSICLLTIHWAISPKQPIIFSCSRLSIDPFKIYPDVYRCASTCVACLIQRINFRVHILYSYYRHRQETSLDITWNMYVIIKVNTLIEDVWWYFTSFSLSIFIIIRRFTYPRTILKEKRDRKMYSFLFFYIFSKQKYKGMFF